MIYLLLLCRWTETDGQNAMDRKTNDSLRCVVTYRSVFVFPLMSSHVTSEVIRSLKWTPAQFTHKMLHILMFILNVSFHVIKSFKIFFTVWALVWLGIHVRDQMLLQVCIIKTQNVNLKLCCINNFFLALFFFHLALSPLSCPLAPVRATHMEY